MDGSVEAETKRSRSYYEAQVALREAVLEALSWSQLAAADAQRARESLEAWCRVGRLAVDARHEHTMLRCESIHALSTPPTQSSTTPEGIHPLSRRGSTGPGGPPREPPHLTRGADPSTQPPSPHRGAPGEAG